MIAVTMGDANGVGPEIVLHAYEKGELPELITVIGDVSALKACSKTLGIHIEISSIEDLSQWRSRCLNIIDAKQLTEKQIQPGTVSRETGAAAAYYVKLAAQMTLDGLFDAMVTLPINKEAVQLTIPGFSGHTELIAEMCSITNYTMMLASPRLVVTHVSTHVSMSRAVEMVTTERVLSVIRLTHEALKGWIEVPRIAVAGLNPHAGEKGLFGIEELDQIIPAVQLADKEGIQVIGPEPPDTVFMRAADGAYDAVVCMYHDQGHIPMKLLDFDHGVNITLGLPIIRTSVDHGTAFDIAWKGKASTASLTAAVDFAGKISGSCR